MAQWGQAFHEAVLNTHSEEECVLICPDCRESFRFWTVSNIRAVFQIMINKHYGAVRVIRCSQVYASWIPDDE